MKRKEKIKREVSLDDIVFEKRNKEYGAYYLRVFYYKYLSRSIVASILLAGMIVGLSFFVVKKNYGEQKTIKAVIDLVKFKKPEPAVTKKLILPPPPPPPDKKIIRDLQKSMSDIPKIVEKEDLTNPIKPNQDDKVYKDDFDKNEGFGNNGDGNNLNPEPKVIEPKKIETVFNTGDVSELPKFPGGDEAMIEFIIKKMTYPKLALNENVQGTVWVQFIVETDGRITNMELVRSVLPDYGLVAESFRVIGEMPRWIPGMQNGYPCRVRLTLPIKFKIQN